MRSGDTYPNPHLIWSVPQLADRLGDAKLVLLDMRPAEAYANGHIPGARSFDIFGISLTDTRQPALDAFLWIIEHLIQAKGVDEDSTVVVYDEVAGMRSARLFWFLEFLGHDDVQILNGGFSAWRESGLPVTHEAKIPMVGSFKMKPRRELLSTVDDVLGSIGDPLAVIVDTRSDGEYSGRMVRASRAGAIPGAIHLEWTNNLDENGFFKPAGDLQQMYASRGIRPEKQVIPYCHGGYRSAHTYLALRLIGYPHVCNYLGSWGEWGNRLDLPVERPGLPLPNDR